MPWGGWEARGLSARQLQFALLLEGQEHALLFTLAAGLL